MTDIDLTLVVMMKSDWHIGSGEGLTKDIDSAVVRDAAGLPFIPAKTMTGVLRERAEQVAEALDADTGHSVWHEWARWVFGSRPDREDSAGGGSRPRPQPAALATESLRLTRSLDADAIAERLGITASELSRATTVLRSSTAIDEHTGTAKKDHLRTEERARAGLEVTGKWSLHADGDVDLWPAVFLLQAAARLTFAIGGKRRRGGGECSIRLEAGKSRAFEELAKEAVKPEPPSAPPTPDVGDDAAAGTAMPDGPLHHAWTMHIVAESPLLVGTTTLGNTVTAASAIPGSVLLGVALRKLGVDPAAIGEHKIVVTEATPEFNRQRSIPWPAVLTRLKGQGNESLANGVFDHVHDPKRKAPTGLYLAPKDGGWAELNPDHVQRMHVSIHPDKDSELFTYEALAAGQSFAAEVWLPEGHGTSMPAAASAVRLGTSKKDDYGAARISWSKAPKTDPVDSLNAGQEFTVFLESDVLLRDAAGAFEPTVDRLLDVLGTALGTVLTEASPTGKVVKNENRVTVTRTVTPVRIDSWQTRWSLPRPSLIGLAAGGVVKVRCKSAVENVSARLASGIGERTAEGFGRVLVDPVILSRETPAVEKRTSQVRGHDATLAGSVDKAIKTAVLSERIRRAVAEVAASDLHRKAWIPSGATRSQLGAVRSLALGLTTEQGKAAFDRWLAGANTIPKRKKIWEKHSGKFRSLLESISSTSEGGAQVWEVLSTDREPKRFTDLLEGLTLDARAAWARTAFQLLLVETTRAGAKVATR